MKLRLYGCLVGIIGQLLILALFLWIFPVTLFGDESILWLDFGVVSIVYWLWMLGSIVYKLDINEESQKVFAQLGITMYAMTIYSVLAIGFALVCVFGTNVQGPLLSFKWQIGFQGCFLFFLLFYYLLAGHAGKQTEKVYYDEKLKTSGKKSVKISIQDLLMAAEEGHFPSYLVQKIKTLKDETRYLSPSTDPSAVNLDEEIASDCKEVVLGANGFSLNQDRIEGLLVRIERNVNRRKQY